MKKYTNKRSLLKKWQEKINVQKEYHEQLRQAGQTEVGFYESEIYKNLNRKRKRAEYRYNNREKISEQRRERREFRKEQVKKLVENLDKISETFSGSAIDAFKGRRATADLEFIDLINPKNFVGELLVLDGETGETLEDSKYISKTAYFKRLAFWVSQLFDKLDGYKIFNSIVTKKLQQIGDTLFYYIEIEIVE